MPGPVDDRARRADLVDQGRRATDEGRLLDAIAAFQEADRLQADPEVERDLVRLRHLAFAGLDGRPGQPVWPPTYPDRFAQVQAAPPEVGVGELSTDVLGSAMVNHGSLLVRGLVGPDDVARLVEGVDRAFAGRDAAGDGLVGRPEDAPWYVPFGPEAGYQGPELDRRWVREGGGVWTADSPRATFELLDLFTRAGLDQVIGSYLGERPTISLRKWVLRRVPADLGRADWHQDGAFLGPDVRSVNVWLALSPCGAGTASPGLELVPRRVELQETGTDGAFFTWSVGPGRVEALVHELDVELVRPRFEAGDALLFDDRMLHRTGVGPDLTEDRYAIETWFFAPSTYPGDMIPIVF